MNFSELVGKTFESIERGSDELVFTEISGQRYALRHDQDCCESVYIEDIDGDLADIQGTPILLAEENSQSDDPEGYVRDCPPESVTWTFYRLGTVNGTVVIRFLGESNGYYSEGVDLVTL